MALEINLGRVESWVESWKLTSVRSGTGDTVAQLEQLYEIYHPMLRDLRAAYVTAGTADALRKVRPDYGAAERELDISSYRAGQILKDYYGNGPDQGNAQHDITRHWKRWQHDYALEDW